MSDNLLDTCIEDGRPNEKNLENRARPRAMDQGYKDRGWAWSIALAACLSNAIIIGSGKSLGLILKAVIEKFHASTLASSVFTTLGALTVFLIAPITSHLTSKIDCRWLVSSGGILYTAGFLISAFATDIYMVYIGLGLLTGVGAALAIPATYIIINQYFEKKISTALAISTLGMGIGGFAMAPLVEYIFREYGYTGALWIMAGIYLNLQVSSALMRPPPKNIKQQQIEEIDNEEPTEDTPLITTVQPQTTTKLSTFKNCSLLLYLLCNFATTFPAALTFLPLYALEFNIATKYSSIMISVYGIADMIGRLSSGVVFDLLTNSRKVVYHSIIGICSGVCIALFSVTHSVWSFFIIVFLLGFGEGIYSAQRMAVPFDFVKAENIPFTVSLIIVAESLGGVFGPLVQSAIKDRYGSYSIGYIIGGTLFSVSCLFMIIDAIIRYLKRR